MTPNSFDQLFESLSALVDNEANELEVRRILKNIEQNPELLERWRRYHLIGSALRKERSMQVGGPNDLAASVATYISSAVVDAAAEGLDSTAQRRGTLSGSWRHRLGQGAVAASFAATLVLGFNFWGQGGEGGQGNSSDLPLAAVEAKPQNESQPTALQAPIGFELPVPEARTVSTAASGVANHSAVPQQNFSQVDDITDFATQQMLNRLLIQHAERASAHGSLGIMPFARVSRMETEAPR